MWRRTELFPYETCIFFTVVTALITLPRQELKAKVVDAPEILTIISTIPHLESFLNSFYSCRYADFLQVCPNPGTLCVEPALMHDVSFHRARAVPFPNPPGLCRPSSFG